MSMQNCDLLALAEMRLAQVFPWFDPGEMKRKISENGHLWELTYELPETMIGGVPIVTIDKRTCEVVRVIHTQ